MNRYVLTDLLSLTSDRTLLTSVAQDYQLTKFKHCCRDIIIPRIQSLKLLPPENTRRMRFVRGTDYQVFAVYTMYNFEWVKTL